MLENEVAPMFVDQPLEVQRATLDAMGRDAQMPPALLVEQGMIGELPVEWLRGPNSENRVVVYAHGGGYVMGSCDSHRPLAGRLALACQAQVVMPQFRLAPEHPFPAPLEDLMATYRSLFELGYTADQIILAGDSAGGGLVLATVLEAQRLGLPTPRAMVMLSPWVDMTLSGESLVTHAERDPWLDPSTFPLIRELYLSDADPSNPLASPLLGDLSALPPTLVQVGSDEILVSDSLNFGARASEAGSTVDIEVWDHMWHVWHFFAPMLPEANAALDSISSFIESVFAPRLRDCG